jgi:uncharacterized protein (TIRG00374 family)
VTSPPPRRLERERLGDRLEHAIAERADVEHEVERGEREQPPRRRLRRIILWLAVTGVSIYLVAPSLVEVLGSWNDLGQIDPAWLPLLAALQGAALACLWTLQRLALHMPRWRPVVTSQLAGNALAKIAPGGGAVGAAFQYRMLVQAGIARAAAVAGITTANLLTFAVMLALPVLVLPAIVFGAVPRSLTHATLAGLAVFTLLFAFLALVLARDALLARVGRTVQSVRNRLRPHSPRLTKLPERLLAERDRILGTLGSRWRRALLAVVGRWAFDYATLLAALAAVGATPRPALVLLAFCAAQLLAQVPITPGGLGFVEAGLTATLALAGVSAGDAVLATFAYRLFQYWMQLPLGLVGLVLHLRDAAPAARSA